MGRCQVPFLAGVSELTHGGLHPLRAQALAPGGENQPIQATEGMMFDFRRDPCGSVAKHQVVGPIC